MLFQKREKNLLRFGEHTNFSPPYSHLSIYNGFLSLTAISFFVSQDGEGRSYEEMSHNAFTPYSTTEALFSFTLAVKSRENHEVTFTLHFTLPKKNRRKLQPKMFSRFRLGFLGDTKKICRPYRTLSVSTSPDRRQNGLCRPFPPLGASDGEN